MTEQNDEKRRKDRFYQQRHRGSKRSYVTEIENLNVLVAWQSETLSEGQAAKLLGTDRVSLREMRDAAIEAALKLKCSCCGKTECECGPYTETGERRR